ncbi:gliding motility-associated C-terminal domain-containing protein [Flagellimonas taeanensis]|uniref:Gliding motility-associated C-terminal domain-containing protein n=1 Tax=Flagellimonas taeanensis TaxID=1005926 RepID=A0A1M6VEF1_9FLAO|nr:gliding motility-associated C-terminal domain-containing protein [Allomuricauda taeanensis]SFC18360.1 gliding motility-associated C-terminal domain-containing protein [Allomuricauda taeanensis]SHK79744.1 gliding motility-associated C-terminal domain-containing protein [Allomuricauda taeanensis]
MKKAGLRNLPSTHSKKIWAPIAFLMSTIYFGGLLANWNRNKDIRMEGELFAPSISLVKTGIARSLSGGPGCDRIEYTYTVTNTSTNGEILLNIEVTDALLGGIVPGPNIGSDIGNDGAMDPGEIWTYTAYYTVQEADIVNGQIANQANVTADIQGQPGVEISDISDDGTPLDGEETVIDLTACQPGISVIKTGGLAIDGFGRPNCGIALYSFQVANEGTFQVLENVVLNDPRLGGNIAGPSSGDDNNIGFLDPGEVWIYNAPVYNVTPEDIANGQVANQATVTARTQNFPGIIVTDLSDDDSPSEDDPTIIDLTQCQGGISLIKTGAAVADIDAGIGCNFIVYRFTVTNESAQVLSNVDLSDPILGNNPPTFDNGDDNNNNLLDPGEVWLYSAIYNITVDDINAGQVINQAEVTADVQNLPGVTVSDLSDNDSPLEDEPTIVDLSACQAGISVIKTGQAFSLSGAPGCDVIQYTFEVNNTSIFYDLDNVILIDPLLGNNALAGPGFGDNNNNNILETYETWIYTAYYNIEETDIVNGQVVNQATVAADVQGLPGIIVTDDSDDNSPLENDPTIVDLTACRPGIYAIKTGQALDLSGAPGCDIIRYTIEVVNFSWIYSLDNVVLTDPLLGVDPIAGPDPGEDVGDDGILAPGETWTFTVDYDITETDIANGQVLNQATVTADVQAQPGESVFDLSDNDSPTEDEPTVVDLSACQGNISLIKSPIVNCDEIEYILGITNNSIYGQELENIVVNDPLLGGDISGPLPGHDIGNDGILSVGEIWLYIAVYDIQQTDVENGQIINQATVTSTVRGMPGVIVSDLSDDDSPLEDNPTVVSLVQCQDPALGLIKEGQVIDINGDGCSESIRYTFSLKNTGGMDLDEVILEDALLGGQVIGPMIGSDENNDGILSFGETWTYEALYAIVQNDIDNGFILNQATVTANTVAGDIPVFDLSDNNDFFEDEMTTTTIPNDACTDGGAAIGLIKQGVLVDTNGDGCSDTIRYTFTITGSGGIAFDNIMLMDPLLGGQVYGPVVGSDQNNDGILSPGETWTFEADYYLAQGDIDTGNVVNQAIVAGEPVGFDIQLMDLSDNDSYVENETTQTIIPIDACTDGGTPIGFEIFNGITPNGDGSNDYFRVQGIENYPDNQLKIYNRWGVLVYESEQYGQGNNLFYGISEGRATFQKDKQLPSGTYFYILTFTGANPGKDSYSGYLYINRD